MKIEFYEEFIRLSETGSFSKAAEALPFSQAALTQHIQQMEADVGTRLFERSTRKVELNEYGKLLLPYANRIVRLKKEALSSVSQRLVRNRFDLSVGFYPTAGRLNFAEKLRQFQELHPEISMECRELLPETLMESMKHGEFDFVLMEELDGEIEDGYDRMCLGRDALAAVVPAAHPLAGYGQALLTQLSKEQFFMLPERSFVYKLGVAACKEQGFFPTITYTSHSIPTILDMISKNNGVSLLMSAPARKFQKSGVSVVDLVPAVYSSINLLFHEEKLSEHGKILLDYMSLPNHM